MKRVLLGLGALAAVLFVAGGLIYLQRWEVGRWYLGLRPYVTSARPPTTVGVPMRDGLALSTHLYLPEGDGPWPAILIRDPYDGNRLFCELFARYDYACVHQDTRGRYGSPGQWYPVVNERDDGLDTLEWLVQQPWQDGNIATFGGSYVGLVQWAMIDAMPPEVKTVIANVSHGDFYDIVHRGGHFVQGVMMEWALALSESESTIAQMAAHRPATDGNTLFLDGKGGWFTDYLNHPDKTDPYWNTPIHLHAREGHQRAHMPVLMTAGWHDFFLDGQLRVFEELPRREQSLLHIRNGSHADYGSRTEAREIMGHYLELVLDWLEHHLRGRTPSRPLPTGYLLQSNVDGHYVSLDRWPPSTPQRVLHLEGLPDSVSCDGGRLDETPSGESGSVSFSYDPASPVPSRGGSYSLTGLAVLDQGHDLCTRGDVLSFASEPIEDGATIEGVVRVVLRVSSAADDTAFTVKLQEKHPDGRVLNIRDEIMSLSFPNGAVSRTSYEAGSTVELVFELNAIRWALAPGSSLRLDISSSNHPTYHAHPNIAGNWAQATVSRTAEQTVFGGWVGLPISTGAP